VESGVLVCGAGEYRTFVRKVRGIGWGCLGQRPARPHVRASYERPERAVRNENEKGDRKPV